MIDVPRSLFYRALLVLAAGALLCLSRAGSLAAQEWYEDYAEGIEASRLEQWEKAAELFEKAIKKNPMPGENVLTHGANQLDRYYPYIQLARAYLMSGNIQGARQALARSVQIGKEPAQMRERAQAAITAAAKRAPGEGPPPIISPRRDGSLRPAGPPSSHPAPAEERATVDTESPSVTPPPSTSARPVQLPATGSLDLRSDPDGSTVLIDGSYIGETPLKVDLRTGTHRVTLRREGYEEARFELGIRGGHPDRNDPKALPRAAHTAVDPAPHDPARA